MSAENVIVKESPIQWLGVFATRDLKEGEWILERDDSRVVTPDDALREDRGEYERHCDYLSGGKVILAGWPERHTNHSCDPNAES